MILVWLHSDFSGLIFVMIRHQRAFYVIELTEEFPRGHVNTYCCSLTSGSEMAQPFFSFLGWLGCPLNIIRQACMTKHSLLRNPTS